MILMIQHLVLEICNNIIGKTPSYKDTTGATTAFLYEGN
jgi:hypothetical protein